MKRTYLIDEPIPLKHTELVLQTAFHEAGHASAIYLSNKQKQLPPVYFQISFRGLCTDRTQNGENTQFAKKNGVAIVEGGHLINSLPLTALESCSYFSDCESHAHQIAYEADIINLLAGPLAEAKFVAHCDDECFNPRLVNVHALKYYGGTADLEKVHEYLNGFIATKEKRHKKLNELFLAAFKFVDNPANWHAITELAHYILNNEKEVISCEEAIEVLDESMSKTVQYKWPTARFRR